MKLKIVILSWICTLSFASFSQDPNFHIYLCIGQSNMEGQAKIEQIDKSLDSRFRVLQAVSCSNLGRVEGTWYSAAPPLTRCWTGLTPVDYFGKKMVANIPSNIKVGVVIVAIAGCKIELYDRDNFQPYADTAVSWMKGIIAEYGGNPYAHLVEMAKIAQKDGVIKGILLHQGESNTGDNDWPTKVKGVYDNLIADLNLNPDSVPLLAGEVVNADQGGLCASMNSIIAKLPNTLPNSYVISSKGCKDTTDNIHFNGAGYRELGRRYATKMLSLMGYEPMTYLETECATVGTNWDKKGDASASNGYRVSPKTGFSNLSTPPADNEDKIDFTFTATADTNYFVYARIKCPSAASDAYWVKMDDGEYVLLDGLTTSSWKWTKLGAFDLTKGTHNLSIGICEEGTSIDKVSVSKFDFPPTNLGDVAVNICKPVLSTVGISPDPTSDFNALESYPNPFTDKTNIKFQLTKSSFVSLKIYNLIGLEIAELARKEFPQGENLIEYNTKELPTGIYFCTLKANGASLSTKIIKFN